jgi:hypothetical protein
VEVKFELAATHFDTLIQTLLIVNGENVKVVQELMRQGSACITVDIYSQTGNPAKREVQPRILEMILSEERCELEVSE